MKSKTVFVGSLLLLSSVLRADDFGLVTEEDLRGLQIGAVATGGNGCPQGSVFSTLDRNNKELLLFLDAMVAEVGGTTRIDRKSCAIAVPLRLPAGVRVTLVETRYEGFNILTDGATSVLSSEAFIAGSQGQLNQEVFYGDLDQDFVVSNYAAVFNEGSACGGDVQLRINSSLRLKANVFGDAALAAITALGTTPSPIIQRLGFRKCNR